MMGLLRRRIDESELRLREALQRQFENAVRPGGFGVRPDLLNERNRVQHEFSKGVEIQPARRLRAYRFKLVRGEA